jgi:hypothetical protein
LTESRRGGRRREREAVLRKSPLRVRDERARTEDEDVAELGETGEEGQMVQQTTQRLTRVEFQRIATRFLSERDINPATESLVMVTPLLVREERGGWGQREVGRQGRRGGGRDVIAVPVIIRESTSDHVSLATEREILCREAVSRSLAN